MLDYGIAVVHIDEAVALYCPKLQVERNEDSLSEKKNREQENNHCGRCPCIRD